MQLQITVAQKDLHKVADFLETEGLQRPDKHIQYSLNPSHKYVANPVIVFVSLNDYTILQDYEEENKEKLIRHD